jgi:hypothetical protein
MTPGLIPSAGRNCGIGSISWPRLQAGVPSMQTKVLNLVFPYVSVVRVGQSTRTSKKNTEKPAEIGQWFWDTVQALWPVADGSLSLRKSSCVRVNCSACAAGEGHRSYVLYGRGEKKRFSIYVPEELVPEVRAALENGRRLKDLISEAGLRYTHALKDERKLQSRTRKGDGDA